MKILLDENLPHDLRHFLAGHEVFTVAYMKWAGIKNGQLLAKAAAAGFHALLSLDSGMEFQQRLDSLPCSVVLISAKSNRLNDLLPVIPSLLIALDDLPARTIVRVP